MNNFQNISAAIILLVAGLGLTACEQKTVNCVATPEDIDVKCGNQPPIVIYCLGDDLICTKP